MIEDYRKEYEYGNSGYISSTCDSSYICSKSGIQHGKGEGGCCGGGGSIKDDKKVLTGDIIATKIVTIDGMHCENCKNSIEHQINRIDGASCEVNLKRKLPLYRWISRLIMKQSEEL